MSDSNVVPFQEPQTWENPMLSQTTWPHPQPVRRPTPPPWAVRPWWPWWNWNPPFPVPPGPPPGPWPPPWPPSQGLQQSWAQIQQFQAFLAQVLTQMYQQGTPPGSGPWPGQTPPVWTGAIAGVVDGSEAKAGQVGEFVTGNATISYTGYPNVTTVNVSPIVLQPGDWNILAFLGMGTLFGGASFILDPIPAGMSNGLNGAMTFGSTAGGADVYGAPMMSGRGNFSQPTLLPFKVVVDQREDSTLTAGQGILYLEARRAR